MSPLSIAGEGIKSNNIINIKKQESREASPVGENQQSVYNEKDLQPCTQWKDF